MVSNSFRNKSFMQPMRRLSMHSSGAQFFFFWGGGVGEFNSYAYKLKRWAIGEHIGATLQNFIDRLTCRLGK